MGLVQQVVEMLLAFVVGWLVGFVSYQLWLLFVAPKLKRRAQYKRRMETRRRNRAKVAQSQSDGGLFKPPQEMPSKSVAKRIHEQTKQEQSNG